MKIENDQITDVTVSVCQDMLGMKIEKLVEPAVQQPDHFASIVISGQENALIQVAACEQAASQISSVMFGVHVEDLDEEEISDAVCEIVNMIGGNIKGILDSECDLSIPCFSKDPGASLASDEAVSFELSGGLLQVICQDKATVQS